MRSGLGHLDEIHRHIVEDHCRAPRNYEVLESLDSEAHVDNPFCGDDVLVQLKLEGSRLAGVCVQGHGCAICQASASIMGELVEGLETSTTEVSASAFRKMLTTDDELESAEIESLGDAIALQDVRRFPIRVKCALLAWVALEDALEKLPR